MEKEQTPHQAMAANATSASPPQAALLSKESVRKHLVSGSSVRTGGHQQHRGSSELRGTGSPEITSSCPPWPCHRHCP